MMLEDMIKRSPNKELETIKNRRDEDKLQLIYKYNFYCNRNK
jgi:hypothetical protein